MTAYETIRIEREGAVAHLQLNRPERINALGKAMLQEMRSGQESDRRAAFGLYFDCVSRGSGLYQIAGHDSAYIRQFMGPVPVAGFFTGFEIGPLGPATGLLQYSGVLALISEKK